ncbi:hypothetical protein SDC9_07993 [bioreactor metagenome]|uniref:Uncharacterized protein n=1 Tax=bioreactor metagenome TaxID=1076179 RepID=A0A644T631_9ZZZZ|nr:hypothetical protein [Candidatus Elulimicrobiales bacterium]
MYSFNLDYIFNIAYNILLAIRYVFLFWILRIDKAQYLADHQYDAWDGLRDRGWIKDPGFSGGNFGLDPNSNVFYLGSGNAEKLSWWDTLRQNLFGWGNGNNVVHSSGSTNYGFNPADVDFAVNKVNNDPWFSNLKFSIQNPIIAFFNDVLTLLTFIVLIWLIYSMLKWLFIILAPVNEAKEKKKLDKEVERKEMRTKRIAELEKLKVQESFQERELEKKEDKIENSLPGGIAGLPIDENDLTIEEVVRIKEKEDILLDYKVKNIIPVKENKVIKIKTSFDTGIEKTNTPTETIEQVAINIPLSTEEKLKFVYQDDRKEWYMTRWNTVIGYMQGKEEAIWRIGILEADNLLDEVLSDRGYKGLTLADKLKMAGFNTIDLAWAAHKVRNRIAHDGSRFMLSDRMARNTIELYRSVFKELKIFE